MKTIDVDPLRFVNAKIYTQAEMDAALTQRELEVREACAKICDKQADTLRRAAHVVQQPTEEALRMAELAILQLNQIARDIRNGKEAPEQWQPIETAPRDGTAVLGYFGTTAGEEPPDMAVTKFNMESSAWISTEVPFDEFDAPTYWQPLPAPPSIRHSEQQEGS